MGRPGLGGSGSDESLAVSEVEQRARARREPNRLRTRTVQPSYQVVEIRVPRRRGQGFVPSFLEPNHRAIREVEGWVEKALMSGLCRSEMIRLMESTTGCRPSRVQLELDSRVSQFRERYRYLFL